MFVIIKVLIFTSIYFVLFFKTTIASEQSSPCDRILIKSDQFECVAAEKAKKLKEKLGFNKAKKKIENLDDKKKNFDKKNKTLKDLFNNMKK